MTAQGRYAIIADEEVMATLMGVGRTTLVGVCVVDDGMAECHVIERREGLAALLDGIPTCPSGFGSGTAFPDFASESEALAMIADAAASRGLDQDEASFPPGFSPALPRMVGGLKARMTGYGLDLVVSDQLAAALEWPEGGNVSLGVSGCGRMLAVSRGGRGARLVRNVSDPGFLHVDRDLSGIPLAVPLRETDWQAPEYQVAGRSVVLAIPKPREEAVTDTRAADIGETLTETPKGRLGIVGMVLLAIGSASAGFLATLPWL